MKVKTIVAAALMSLSLSSCSAWISGNKTLADTDTTDQQLSAKITDGTSTQQDVEKIFGEKMDYRNTRSKSVPDGKLAIAQYKGHLNGFGGTYAHRYLFVAYDSNNVVVNHAITVSHFTEKNNFETNAVNVKNAIWADLNKGDPQSKALSMLGAPREATFTDSGNLLWIYSNANVTRDASSYVPLFNAVAGTESGIADRVYVEFNRQNQVENLWFLAVNISQGLGFSNASEYKETITKLDKKY